MAKARIFVLISLCIALTLCFFYSCIKTPESPYQPSKATISLTVNSPTLIKTMSLYVDSVGNSINIGISSNLPMYIDSILIEIDSAENAFESRTILKGFDTLKTNVPFWYKTLFTSPGIKSIVAQAFIQEKHSYSDTIKNILIIKKPVITVLRSKPRLDISGIRNITPAQTCTLKVSAQDSNALQAHTFYFQQDLNMSTVFTSPFWWTPPTGFIGTHQVFFKVIDSDDPNYFDTATVFINVSATIATPNTPNNIQASVSNGILAMSWEKTTADDYIIFRSAAKQGPFLARKTVFSEKFLDTINSLDYYYYVKSYNSVDSSISSDTIFSGKLRSVGPHWFLDTIGLVGTEGTTVSLPLIGKCAGDSLSFFIASVPPVKKDTIIGTTFSYTFGVNDTATYWPKIVAKNKTGLVDTVTIKLLSSKTGIDSIAPVIKYLNPGKDSISVNANSYKVMMYCTDQSGIASVKCAMGADTFITSRSLDTVWSATVSGLVKSQYNKITFTATDLSPRKNLTSLSVYIKYDTTVIDTVGPTFSKISGPSSGTTISNPIINYAYTVSDPNGIDSVYWTLNNVRQGILSVNNNKIMLSDTLQTKGLYHIVIYAMDKSGKHNIGSENIDLTYDATINDKTGPTILKISGPSNGDKISDPSVTLVYSVNDSSGVDSVYWTLNNVRLGVLSPDANSHYTITTVLSASHYNKIGIYASDKSSAHNKSSDSITVNYNRPPVIIGAKDTTIQELSAIKFIVSATDPDNDKISLKAPLIPSGATFDTTTGVFLWSPTSSQKGANSAVFKAFDGFDTTTQSITITITNMPIPTITTNPQDQTKCLGSPVSFSIVATGTGALTYQWQNSSGDLTDAHYIGAKTNTLSITTITANDANTYTCVVSNSAGSKVASNGAKLTVNVPSSNPTGAIANPSSICSGSTSMLTVSGGALGSGAFWKWYKDSACTTPALTINSGASITVSPTANTTYYVRAEGTCNTTLKANVTVTLNSQSTTPTSALASPASLCSGNSATLSVTGGSLGTGALWKWYTNSACTTPVSGGNSGSTLVVSPTVNTTYYVRAEGICNTTTSANAAVTINSQSTAPTSVTANPATLCPSSSSTLTVNGGSLGTGASWKWYTNSACTTPVPSNNTGATITVSPNANTTYYVRAEGTCNSSASVNSQVTLNTISTTPSASASTANVTLGNSTNLTVTTGTLGTGAKWKWYSDSCGKNLIDSGTSISHSPCRNMSYYVRAEGGACGSITDCATPVNVTVNNGLVAYWPFETNNGNTFADLTGHGYDITATGTTIPTLVAGKKGNAISCSDAGYDLPISNSANNFSFTSFTVEAWFNPNTIPTDHQNKIFEYSYLQGGLENGFSVFLRENGYLGLSMPNPGHSNWAICQSPNAITANTWNFVVATYDGNDMNVYVNGVLQATVNNPNAAYYAGGVARIGVQKLIDGTSQAFADGLLDEIKMYNYAIDAATVTNHYNNP